MSLKVNKKSVKQDGGAMIPEQPGMQQQPQVDPAIQQIGQFIKQSLEEGAKPEELIMNLIQQEVDQQTIGQAFMLVGYEQEDVITLFEQVQALSEERAASPREVNQNPQELARNQQIQERQQGPVETESIDTERSETMMAQSGIEIKPENKGKFTKWAKARGMAVQEAASKVLANKDRYPTSVVKMANFAKNAAGWNKAKDGGEFEPHFMYKGDRKIRAKDMETHLRLKEAGYNHNAPKAQDGNGEVISKLIEEGETFNEGDDKMSQFMTNMNTTLNAQNNSSGNNNIKKTNNTISQGPLYISPNIYEDDGFSLGNAYNSVMRVGTNLFSSKDLDGDGRKDGSLRDFGAKMGDAKTQKYLDATYNINTDDVFTEENIKNADIAYKKFLFENPTADDQYDAVGNLVNKGLEDNNIPIEITSESSKEEYKDFIEKNTELLGKTAKATYDALIKKLGFKLGGSLPRAQYSVPDNGAPLATPVQGSISDGSTFEEWVLQDPIRRGGANAMAEWEALKNQPMSQESNPFVDQADATMPNPVTVTPASNPSISPTDWDKDGDGIPDMGIDIDMGDGTGVAGDFQSAYDNVVKPTIEPDFGGIGGALKRGYNSPITKGFEGISGGIVDLTANIFNPWMNKGKADQLEQDNRSRIVADELFAVETDPFNSRGLNDVNRGTKGSEADRTTGLYLAYGGSTGPEAYMANKGGETVSVDSTMLAKLIAAGADIEIL